MVNTISSIVFLYLILALTYIVVLQVSNLAYKSCPNDKKYARLKLINIAKFLLLMKRQQKIRDMPLSRITLLMITIQVSIFLPSEFKFPLKALVENSSNANLTGKTASQWSKKEKFTQS